MEFNIINKDDKKNILSIDVDNINAYDTIQTKEVSNYEIWTPEGWKPFSQIKKITKPYYYKLITENNNVLEASPYHRIKMIGGDFAYIHQLSIGDILFNKEKIISIEKINKKIELYDILGVEGEEYYTNSIISHNCAAIDRSNPERMNEIWSSAGITLTRSKGKCVAISCVTKDTYVFTNKGLEQIADYIPVNIDPSTQQGHYLDTTYRILGKDKLRESNLFYCNGKTSIYKVTTFFSDLKGSSTHKLWVYSQDFKDYKIKTLKDITNKDWVNIQYGMNIWGDRDNIDDFGSMSDDKIIFNPKVLTPDICYLLGLCISKSLINKTTTEYNDTLLIIDCENSIIEEILKKLNLPFSQNKPTIYINSLSLIEFLEYLGLNIQEPLYKREIPKRLLQCSKENIRALLQAIFDANSNINPTNISLTLDNPQLIEQIRMLLLNFGCLSHSSKNSLRIYALEAIKFYNEIGFRSTKQQNDFYKIKEKKFNDRYDILPNSEDIIQKLYSLARPPLQKKIKTFFRYKSRKKIEELISLIIQDDPSLKDHPYILFLKEKVLIKNSIWTQVNSNEIIGEDLVYDFSLPHEDEDEWSHSIIYNGILGEQTPKGQSGWYFEQYTNAEANGWNIIEAHWLQHPVYSQGAYQYIKDDKHPEGGHIKYFNETWPAAFDKVTAEAYKTKETYNYIRDGRIRSPWYDVESKKLGPQRTRCELDCSFAGSGSEVLDPEIIRAITISAKNFPPLPTEQTHIPNSGIWKSYKQFKLFTPTHGYLISADVSTGDGSDFSAFVVVDITEHEVVATYKDQIEPLAYAKILHHVGKNFGNCLLIVENQGPGLTTLLELKNLGYPNIFYHTLKKTDVTKNQKRKLGFWQGEQTRLLGSDRLEEDLNTNKLKIYSQDIITELHTWIWDKDGKRRHAPGKNDDLIMALTNAMFYIYYIAPKKAHAQSMMRQHLQIITNKFADDIIDYRELMNNIDDENIFNNDEKNSPDQYEKLRLWNNLNKRN